MVCHVYQGGIQLLHDDVEKFLSIAKIFKIEGLGEFRNDYEIIQEGDFKIEELDSKESVSLNRSNVEDEEDDSGGGNEEFHLEQQLNVPKEDGQLMDTAKLCDEDIKEKIMRHLKPLVNVIYSNGDYYIYQSDSLLNEPGLSV